MLQTTALRLQGRSNLIDTEELMRVMSGIAARRPFLESCEFLLKKAGRKEATEALLGKQLGPIGFEPEHLRALQVPRRPPCSSSSSEFFLLEPE